MHLRHPPALPGRVVRVRACRSAAGLPRSAPQGQEGTDGFPGAGLGFGAPPTGNVAGGERSNGVAAWGPRRRPPRPHAESDRPTVPRPTVPTTPPAPHPPGVPAWPAHRGRAPPGGGRGRGGHRWRRRAAPTAGLERRGPRHSHSTVTRGGGGDGRGTIWGGDVCSAGDTVGVAPPPVGSSPAGTHCGRCVGPLPSPGGGQSEAGR